MTRRFLSLQLVWLVLVAVGCIARPDVPVATSTVTPVETPDFTGLDVRQWTATAPDQRWTAAGLAAIPADGGERYYTELQITNADGSIIWTPVAGWSNFGLGYTTPQVVHWSADGQRLYFTNTPNADGCALFVNASDLQTLDLKTGQVTEVLPMASARAIAVASDETIAYVQATTLTLLDAVTGAATTLTLDLADDTTQLGNLVWSPDRSQVALTVAYAPCQPPDWRHAIYVVTREGMVVRELLPPDERRLTMQAWGDDGRLRLIDFDGKPWLLDVAQGEIAPG